jgi:SAM-dependent methyltransferase
MRALKSGNLPAAMKHIHSYYSPNDLYNRIVEGLTTLGVDPARVTLDDLKPVDEFHIRGDVATKELIKLSGFTTGMHIIDVGCGIGGSARRLAHEIGCRVTGVDLSDAYIDAAQKLTALLHMQERVTFRAASALDMPFEDNTFDGAWSIQMGMNIEDKLTWMKEVCRVIKPGGRAVLYEVCASKNSPIHFPVPWAQDLSMSFLVTPGAFREVITRAGFAVDAWHEKTDLAKVAFSEVQKPVGEGELPILGSYLLVGRDIKTKAWNLRRNLDEERVSLVELVAVKPSRGC